MKKSIVASIIGVVATVAAIESSYGQGSVFFNNYGATTDAIITRDAGLGGGPATGLNASLLYSFGGGPLTALAGSTAFNAAIPGYFTGPIVTIPGYAGGAISFVVQAWNGAAYGSPTTTIQGQSAQFTLNSIATGTQPVGEFGAAFLPFQVSAVVVPEPSTLALIGLGTGALLFLRRRK